MKAAALWYARMGFDVMPRYETRDDRLIDALKGSPRTGLVGEQEVESYFAEYPETSAIAVVTGPQSNILVVDVDQHGDGPDGLASLRALEAEHGPLPSPPTVLSTSGRGRHLYFAWPGGKVRNGEFAPGIELLGDRMAANLPPSTKGGKPYRWKLDRHLAYVAPPPVPGWLLAKMRPTAPPPRPTVGEIKVADRYVQAALDDEVDAVCRAGPGTRNATLNRAAWSIGRLVAMGLIHERDAERALVAAARTAKLPDKEAARVVRRAFEGRAP